MLVRFCTIFLLCTSTFFFSTASVYETAYLEGGFESKNAFINYVVINGVRYIVKQKKECKKTIISVIRDALAAYIAKDLGVAHSVEIIAPDDDIAGKIYDHCPATLLTIARGKIIRHLQEDHKYFQLSLQQRNVDLDEKILNKWLDEGIISQITWHKQLPIIIALDLFLCNTDRHRGNLFYDDATDSFCAIDMDNIYRRNLPEFACKNLKKMIHDRKQFSKQERKALKRMKKTLEFLCEHYTPDHIIAQLYTFAQQAGYVDDDSEVNHSVTKKMTLHKDIIRQSYDSTRKLIAILNGIIKKQKK
jgi:hypothetical protein